MFLDIEELNVNTQNENQKQNENQNDLFLDIEELNVNTNTQNSPDIECLKEVDITSNLENSLETITLINRKLAYQEKYKKAREKVKDAKKKSVLAYLELKNIKKRYMLDDLDEYDLDEDDLDDLDENDLDEDDLDEDDLDDLDEDL